MKRIKLSEPSSNQMRNQSTFELVKLHCFVQATRDSGYKSAANALAELVDNAIEADAEVIDIEIASANDAVIDSIAVSDNGTGMSRDTLALALQFGGSTRFNSRDGAGRFGMGLPNSCVSQAKRVDVISWENRSEVWATYLDVDQLLKGESSILPIPRKVSYAAKTRSGTIVRLTRCDRIQYKSVAEASARLATELARMFRNALHQGVVININGKRIAPFDPLYLRTKSRTGRATSFGPPLVYKIRCGTPTGISNVTVLFSQLPIAEWNGLSNQEKNRLGIAKGAGVSILRAGREIDYGWYFMGTKRKENYDDWWRCEVRFEPDLDEAFGVTHTKQGIRPTEDLESLLAPDLERIARDLNSKVRRQFAEIKSAAKKTLALTRVDRRDHLLEPPTGNIRNRLNIGLSTTTRGASLGGLKYSVQTQETNEESFYEVVARGMNVTIVLNQLHPFYERIYQRIPPPPAGSRHTPVLENIKALLAAAARAELAHDEPNDRAIILKFRRTWSNALVAFLS